MTDRSSDERREEVPQNFMEKKDVAVQTQDSIAAGSDALGNGS